MLGRIVTVRPSSHYGASAIVLASDDPHVNRIALATKVELCRNALKQVRRLASAEAFGPICGQLLARASEVIDELDEALGFADPHRDCEWFASAASLHRELEDTLSLVPHEHRWLRRQG